MSFLLRHSAFIPHFDIEEQGRRDDEFIGNPLLRHALFSELLNSLKLQGCLLDSNQREHKS